MFDVIDALEALGADSDLVDASSVTVDAMLQGRVADPAVRAAILAGDGRTLATLLRAPETVCIFIHPPGEKEAPEEEEDEEDEEGEEEEDEDAEPVPGKAPKSGAS